MDLNSIYAFEVHKYIYSYVIYMENAIPGFSLNLNISIKLFLPLRV